MSDTKETMLGLNVLYMMIRILQHLHQDTSWFTLEGTVSITSRIDSRKCMTCIDYGNTRGHNAQCAVLVTPKEHCQYIMQFNTRGHSMYMYITPVSMQNLEKGNDGIVNVQGVF